MFLDARCHASPSEFSPVLESVSLETGLPYPQDSRSIPSMSGPHVRFDRWKRKEASIPLVTPVDRCVGTGNDRGDVLPITFEHSLENHLLWCCR